jgi:hypothetical protein
VDARRFVPLPCVVGSLNSLRQGEELVLVKLLLPHNGRAAWVSKHDVTILEQSAELKGSLKALLRSTFIDENDEAYVVEITDGDHPHRMQVPKVWLSRELPEGTDSHLAHP